MINKVSEIFKKILRKNERNLTEQRWDFVYKIPQNSKAEDVLQQEKNYADSFETRSGKNWKMPEQEKIQENDKNILKMPYYPGEVMATLKEKIEKWEDYLPLLQNVLDLVTQIREKHQNSTKTVEKDTTKRFGKYLIGSGLKIVQNNVLSILDKKQPKIKMFDFAKLSAISLKNLGKFSSRKNDEYKIHGCLHLEHIRIDNDGKLVPIDFEHGANYPRRHKYQDEAYIYQNLLQYFPNHKVANDFLVLWLRSVNMEDKKEMELVKIALNEKILGWIYEMYSVDSQKFEWAIKQHINFARDFDQKIPEFRI